MKSSLIFVLFLASFLANSSGAPIVTKVRDYITNGFYTAWFDDDAKGYLPYFTTGDSHSAGADKPITFSDEENPYTSYFSLQHAGNYYNNIDWVTNHLSSLKTDAVTYKQYYVLPDVAGNALQVTVVTSIQGTNEANSFISVKVSVTDNCENADNTATLRPKFRFLVDVDVDGDDGPIAYKYNDGATQGSAWTVETSINSNVIAPATIVFASSAENTKDADRYRVHIHSRGDFVGPDVIQYASWKDSATYPMYQYTPASRDISSLASGDTDDAALIYYFDASSCGDGNGYRLVCGRPTYIELRLFVQSLAQTFPSGACYYCASYSNDADGDTVGYPMDVCLNTPVPKRACNSRAQDWDSDTFLTACDWCPWKPTSTNNDGDSDTIGDDCDNCVATANTNQANADGDNYGDACDNCVNTQNNDQANTDGDNYGNACDNCVSVANNDQANTDGDNYGNACDNCVSVSNNDQANPDGDNFGSACDNCPNNANNDQANTDGDAHGNACDNCVSVPNNDQANPDGDNFGSACDNCPGVANNDQFDGDTDTVGNVCDNCPETPNTNQNNQDGDSYGDVCDNCPYVWQDDLTNSDADSYGDVCDNCPINENEDQGDLDGDAVGDVCDNCRYDVNPDQANNDGDNYGNACDSCKNSRWEQEVLNFSEPYGDGEQKYVPNIYIDDGCYLSDYVDECTTGNCVTVNDPPERPLDKTLAGQLY